MNSPTIGALLAHDKADRYRSFGAFGKPAYQSHVQMRAMLRAQRGARVANFFARPTYDPDSGELRWTSEVPGEARAWHQMSPEEQARHAADKFLIHGELLGLITELREKGGAVPGGAAAFANLLEQAMKVPADDKFTFFVGNQPMIAFWGFSDAGGASVVASAPPLQSSGASAGAVAGEPLFVAPAVEPKRKRPWLWWLLWLLLALLLLALLLLLPRACTPAGSALLAPGDAASAPPGPERGLDVPAPGASVPVPGVGTGLGAVPDGSAVPGGAAALDPNFPAASQPGGAPAVPETPRDDKAAKPDKPDPAASAGAMTLPKDDPTTAEKDAKGRTDPPVPPIAQKDRDMKLPDKLNEAKKMDFLEGDWKAGEGLFDKRTQKPLDLGIKFGKNGQGELTLRQPNGTMCKGAVQGRVDVGKLAIQGNQQLPCSDGSSYGAPKIECAKETSGQTQCYGVNPDGSRYFMGMRRQ